MAASGSDRAHDSLLKRKLINNFFNYSEPFNYKHEILVASESMQRGRTGSRLRATGAPDPYRPSCRHTVSRNAYCLINNICEQLDILLFVESDVTRSS